MHLWTFLIDGLELVHFITSCMFHFFKTVHCWHDIKVNNSQGFVCKCNVASSFNFIHHHIVTCGAGKKANEDLMYITLER